MRLFEKHEQLNNYNVKVVRLTSDIDMSKPTHVGRTGNYSVCSREAYISYILACAHICIGNIAHYEFYRISVNHHSERTVRLPLEMDDYRS